MKDKHKVMLCCGHAGLSGVPIYVASLIRSLQDVEIHLISDFNEGAFDLVAENVASYTEQYGLKSSFSPIKLIKNLLVIRRSIIKKGIKVVWAHSSGAIFACRLAVACHSRPRPPCFMV